MSKNKKSINGLMQSLQERTKELNCIYRVEKILNNFKQPLSEVCMKIIDIIPPGWQYPDICQSKIVIEDEQYHKDNLTETEWNQSADITVNNIVVGSIYIYYTEKMPVEDNGPFLEEEGKLISTIAERLGHFIMHQRMDQAIAELENVRKSSTKAESSEWRAIMLMLKQTDRNLYTAISRKMLNHLCWRGIEDAVNIMKYYSPKEVLDSADLPDDWNLPLQTIRAEMPKKFEQDVFDIASNHLSDEEILILTQRWIHEDKLSFLVQVVNRNLSLAEVADAIRRYSNLAEEDPKAKSPNEKGIQVSLIRRFLSDNLMYINVLKHFIEIRDFYHLLQKVIFTSESHGRLGGKSAGLYLAAQILKYNKKKHDILENVKVPKTWHITSDVLLHFMHYNNFEEVVEQKYKEIAQVRLEYPHVVKTFKQGTFPPDIVRGLSMALDDFDEKPLIVRSSSLLEDRVGAAFSGKYKSLFLANQGTKEERLNALMDAIAEVYASTFSPDPIEYRTERNLLDFGEEMGIIIQEVVGNQIGKYFLPAFAGVAFSQNEFRWSPRIKREDGLVRLVPGLGTRAVDRLSDDYPILFTPGQPGLKVNVQPDEILKYSPQKIDVIDLEKHSFQTITLSDFLEEVGYDFPNLNKIISIYKEGHITDGTGLIDYESGEPVVTFNNLFKQTPFVKQIKTIMTLLEEAYGQPIDIEFAHDGNNFYLLQCRTQSYSRETSPAPIPKNTPLNKMVFSANKYISNGRTHDITHIVYVSPEEYANLSTRQDILEIGRAISKLNKLLPKRQFILMGPGRWGSRGDIKLGVNVTYSDINNTAVLIEIARKKGNYQPDLSFGTHFFQDLVEAEIRYLPLYPDDEGIIFNTMFLQASKNFLADILPEYKHLGDVIKVIDVPQSTDGEILKVLMNAELEEAVGIITPPTIETESKEVTSSVEIEYRDEFWRWRYQMIERLANEIESNKLGVLGLYIFGSTKNATAGPGSDIDLLVHFGGSDEQREELGIWLNGWSLALDEINYMRTGYKSDGLLDIHIITDKDIANKTSYADKIGASTDPAQEIPLGKKSK